MKAFAFQARPYLEFFMGSNKKLINFKINNILFRYKPKNLMFEITPVLITVLLSIINLYLGT